MTSTTQPNTTVATAIDLHQVSLLYPDGQNPDGSPRTVAALDQVNFTAAKGELTALVGESGSGKSSLLSVIGALVRPTSGTVLVGDTNVEKLDDAEQAQLRRDTVGLIFQQPNLLSALGVRDQLLVTDHLRGLGGKELKLRRARADELLDVVGLADMADRKIHALSGGQRQRVNIARALMGTPQVLLADEPTSALDQSRSHDIMQLLKTLTEEFSVATVVVTHDRGLVQYADQEVTLSDGRVVSAERVVAKAI
ncbi:MAG TPA: ATP-binding cassette domain-containing protein [Enteractinococcus helveticum]|uniref:ATP-binding cassette domain-containing protein n=1 Tax=Enteractinococcus helveticum TaxID=1837282 RepID=A0A921FMJ3_9MICC|nr:ATP-binding cassette domain-containing protein [Enteractinococcus helveticum]HJF14809.1 ATP-binding cassette domain-containing protein [Enteractinococcus helveticum]